MTVATAGPLRVPPELGAARETVKVSFVSTRLSLMIGITIVLERSVLANARTPLLAVKSAAVADPVVTV